MVYLNLNDLGSFSGQTARHLTDVSLSLSQDLEGDKARVFNDVSQDVVDVNFGITSSPELFKEYKVEKEAVVLFKKVG